MKKIDEYKVEMFFDEDMGGVYVFTVNGKEVYRGERMKIVMDTKDLRAMLKFRKEYEYCQVFDSGDNTDGEGVWHCDVHFGDDPDALKDGDGEEVYSFDSIYNDHTKYMSDEGRSKYENQR